MCNTELAFGYFSVANKPSISVYLEYYKVSNVNFSVAIITQSMITLGLKALIYVNLVG